MSGTALYFADHWERRRAFRDLIVDLRRLGLDEKTEESLWFIFENSGDRSLADALLEGGAAAVQDVARLQAEFTTAVTAPTWGTGSRTDQGYAFWKDDPKWVAEARRQAAGNIAQKKAQGGDLRTTRADRCVDGREALVNPCKRSCCWTPIGHSTVRDTIPAWNRNACHCHDDIKPTALPTPESSQEATQ